MEAGIAYFWEHPQPLLLVGGLLFVSYWLGRLAHRMGAPKVTGYILGGMLLSPSLSGLMRPAWVHSLDWVADLTLALIALLIGGSLEWRKLRKLRSQVIWITFTQGMGAVLVVFLVMQSALGWILQMPLPGDTALSFALLLGALSAATAPASTLAIVRETRSAGPFTRTLLGVVALDDALAILLFALSLGILGSLDGTHGVLATLTGPVLHILGSLALGAAGAWVVRLMVETSSQQHTTLAALLSVSLIVAGLALHWGLSPLLANMALGALLVNVHRHHRDYFASLEPLEEPLYGLFFILAGAQLELDQLASAGSLAVALSLSRALGKIGGTWMGGKFSGAGPLVTRYLGWALLPKAGVTLGLALLAQEKLGEPWGQLLMSGVIGSVVLDEVAAPLLTKWALSRSGEAQRLP